MRSLQPLWDKEISSKNLPDGFPAVMSPRSSALARCLIGRRPYKQDVRAKQSAEHYEARRDMLSALTTLDETRGLRVVAPESLAEDPQGDHLDALLCAVQAAWSCLQPGYGIPGEVDTLEGWIVGPPPT